MSQDSPNIGTPPTTAMMDPPNTEQQQQQPAPQQLNLDAAMSPQVPQTMQNFAGNNNNNANANNFKGAGGKASGYGGNYNWGNKHDDGGKSKGKGKGPRGGKNKGKGKGKGPPMQDNFGNNNFGKGGKPYNAFSPMGAPSYAGIGSPWYNQSPVSQGTFNPSAAAFTPIGSAMGTPMGSGMGSRKYSYRISRFSLRNLFF